MPSHWRSGRALVAVSLLLGSLPGAWLGASWATRMRAATLHPVLGVQRVADLTRRCTSALLTMVERAMTHRSHRWLV
jgi:hypothetical protein